MKQKFKVSLKSIFCWFSKFRGGEMSLRSLLKLNNSISVRNFAPKFGWRPTKKVFATFWFYLSPEFRFLDAKWALLAKKPKGSDIFPSLQRQTWEGVATRLPKIDAYADNQTSLASRIVKYLSIVLPLLMRSFMIFFPKQIIRQLYTVCSEIQKCHQN